MTFMNKPFTLYGKPATGSLVVQIALEEAGLPYERVWVGNEAADVERFRSINPTGKVPALQLPDGTVMFESAAMLIFLATQNGAGKLAPEPGTSRYALFLQWMAFLSANVYESALRLFYSSRYSARGESDAAAISTQGAADYACHLTLIGRALNPYVLGAEYSAADAYLYMLASWLPEKEALFGRVPALATHAGMVASRPAVRKVEADHAKHS
jgi:glutathione S-transferase